MSREAAEGILRRHGLDATGLAPPELKRRWQELARQHHPDLGGDTGAMQEINAAYAFLKPSVPGWGTRDTESPRFRGLPAWAWAGHGVDSVVPDLMTFGKVMGGGFPAAAFGGRADVMGRLAPVGPVYQAGTLSGNPVATAAGLATLRAADESVYLRVDKVAVELAALASEALSAAGVAHRLQHAGSMFSIFFSDESAVGAAVTDYESARKQDVFRYAAFFHAMLDAGVYLPPSAFESWFLSAAHDDDAVTRVVDALPAAARAAAAARLPEDAP